MRWNAYILDWTMDDYQTFKETLSTAGFAWRQEGETNYMRVAVPFDQVTVFGRLCQKHLNKPVNYVDIQYPDQKTTVIIFQSTIHFITTSEENKQVKTWAIGMGLPPEQADWRTSY